MVQPDQDLLTLFFKIKIENKHIELGKSLSLFRISGEILEILQNIKESKRELNLLQVLLLQLALLLLFLHCTSLFFFAILVSRGVSQSSENKPI